MKITHDDLAAFIPSLTQTGDKTLLHIGCGAASPNRMPACFRRPEWQEIKLDIDPEVCPDIIASITDMSQIADASIDAVWSSHNLEHIETHAVPVALKEIRRVLRPGGFALINLPNLERIAQLISQAGSKKSCTPLLPVPSLHSICSLVTAIPSSAAISSWHIAPASPPSAWGISSPKPALTMYASQRAPVMTCGQLLFYTLHKMVHCSLPRQRVTPSKTLQQHQVE